jgi:Protein of unknown function (DUF2568)
MLVPRHGIRQRGETKDRGSCIVELVTSSNLIIRFALELGSLAALGYAGFQTDRAWFIRVLIGVGAPLLAAVLWGTLVAPAAETRLPDPWRLIPEFAVFGSAALGLMRAGHPTAGAVFGAATIVNSFLDRALGA